MILQKPRGVFRMTLFTKGQTTLPIAFRRYFNLKQGQKLKLEPRPDNTMVFTVPPRNT